MANPVRRPVPAQPAPTSPSNLVDTQMWDRELDAWLDRAFRSHRADPEPVLRDLD